MIKFRLGSNPVITIIFLLYVSGMFPPSLLYLTIFVVMSDLLVCFCVCFAKFYFLSLACSYLCDSLIVSTCS